MSRRGLTKSRGPRRRKKICEFLSTLTQFSKRSVHCRGNIYTYEARNGVPGNREHWP